jgi:hypothetical protein
LAKAGLMKMPVILGATMAFFHHLEQGLLNLGR